jgi:hypothetical protein
MQHQDKLKFLLLLAVVLVVRKLGAGGGRWGVGSGTTTISGPLSIPITVGPGVLHQHHQVHQLEILVQMGQIQPLDLLPILIISSLKVVAVEEEMLQMEAGATGGSGGGQMYGPGSYPASNAPGNQPAQNPGKSWITNYGNQAARRSAILFPFWWRRRCWRCWN